jgi:predicted transport protein
MGMPASKQEEIYTRYWYPMEQRFGHSEYAKLFDRFMRDYLTVKSKAGTIPNIDAVYSEFKKYIQGRDITEVVADVDLFSRYFVRLAFPDRNEDPVVRAIMENINTLKVDVAYPLLLEAFDDFEQGSLLTREDFIEILDLVESYVLRRAIVGIPTNSMNKTFATFKRSIDKDDYLNSVKYAFMKLDSYRRFPRDEEFVSEFVLKDIYNLSQRRNYMLSKLENNGRKERVNIEEYTIEHVMPQNENLSAQWQRELGDDWKDIQIRYLHTIGNLTLTGYNSELSDRPFLEKRDMTGGFADSPLRLNRGLAKLDRWGREQIEQRSTSLSHLALGIWKFPNLAPEVITRYEGMPEVNSDEYSLDHFEHLNGDILELFEALRKRILNLDSSVRQEIKKNYIAYKTTTNFVDIVPQKSRLRLSLNMRFDEINDPEGKCNDVTDKGRWGNGDIEVGISSMDEIEYILFLIRQSFEKHTDTIVV